ncbi:alanine racemase [Aeromicrobium fastidiosum]|uniref:Alanine racemase n=1 Tax=Aeromicrobium fastidiosum TaxID=52699 RepID=A0A641AIV8_9ACTN|nr:alanine racemase [Aeromicrobium fastidiosum]KAA1374672.1 alanine racemase [Aeromicrobium fastidiosum]MBP2390781.1 alanine racemase [Aeromicrobium fastidiosum]
MTSPPQIEAVIDLEAFAANIAALAACAPTSALMTVLKANAYGHGMIPMARAARAAGSPWLGVATVDEALELRAAGDTGALLCWLASPGASFGAAVEAGVELTASSAEQLREIADASRGASDRPRVQLKVDTGLSRNGARGPQWTELVAAAAAEQAAGHVEITGTWSHFACADEPNHPANDAQQDVFRDAVDELSAAGVHPGLRHLANSAATLTRPSSHLDLVRVGIAAYGIRPDPTLTYETVLTPVMTLRARIAQVKRVPAGAGVSYGHQWTAGRATTLALVPTGYGDGIAIAASNRAELQVRGERVPLVGRVCMDQLVVDLGDGTATRGDVATLFGPGHDGEPTAQDWATASGTIAYEVVTRVGGRTVRTYKGLA